MRKQISKLELLPVSEVIEAAEITLSKWGSTTKERAFKYFCAICWRKIKESHDGKN
jgi:hypothetical protein